jgi:N6-adenosine-specific RNA methylase IME4
MKFPDKKYQVVYADPPWAYYGSKTKMGAAGKHYPLMSKEDIYALPVHEIMESSSALFLWATCPRLDWAIHAIEEWGLNFRGVAYVWVKTRLDGVPIGARGVTPTFTKPLTEMVLAATPQKTGRPLRVLDLKQTQTVFAPVGRHSAKPTEVRFRITSLCEAESRIELFARERTDGWDAWGDEVNG